MKTKTVTTETPSIDDLQVLIKQAVVLNHVKIFKDLLPGQADPMHLLTQNIGEELYNLLVTEGAKSHDWGSALWQYKDLMLDLLTLIAKPGILAQLPNSTQVIAASMLYKLFCFFEGLDFSDTRAFMDYHHSDYLSNDDETLKRLARFYDLSKLEENPGVGHFFGEFKQEREWEQNAMKYYNTHFRNV